MRRERKNSGRQQTLGKHIDGLDRSCFCDLENSGKHACYKQKIESNKQDNGETGRNKFIKKERDARQSKALEKLIVAGIVPLCDLGLIKPV